jgi:hypothetical protein
MKNVELPGEPADELWIDPHPIHEPISVLQRAMTTDHRQGGKLTPISWPADFGNKISAATQLLGEHVTA